jgi:hypothetical protein
MDDFDVAPDKIGESAQRVINRAVEETRRREHAIAQTSTSSSLSRRSNGTRSLT